MSRELKFRAWYDDGSVEYNVSPRSAHEIVIQRNIGELGFEGVVCIEQYTGLKDKNGKEIYEGDIIAQTLIDDPVSKSYPAYIVYWNEEFLSWGIKDVEDDDGDDSDLHFFVGEKQKCEIIGNIHESPKLLEEGDV